MQITAHRRNWDWAVIIQITTHKGKYDWFSQYENYWTGKKLELVNPHSYYWQQVKVGRPGQEPQVYLTTILYAYHHAFIIINKQHQAPGLLWHLFDGG